MNEPSSLLDNLSVESLWRLEEDCCRFEQLWRGDQPPRVEDFLGGVDGFKRQALLRELLRLELHYRRRAGEEPSIEEYAGRFPDATAVLSEVFPALQEDGEASAAAAPGVNSTVDDTPRSGSSPKPISVDSSKAQANDEDRSVQESASCAEAAPASRFRVRRFHAKGGLGEVFVAEDMELHREVALKQIQRNFTDHEQNRARFVLEAEITGNLEHPGIVPVYGLGSHPDGRPYYAMRFIRGDTLSEAIARFHSQPSVRFDSLEFRQLLGRLLAVCQAVAYAHNRGVLHRDLKPHNVMLGKFGETLVVDWGLAKVVGRPDGGQTGAEEPLRPLAGRAQETVGIVGTPAFMSPEQAAGKVNELGPATDVYSLGATLYELLTNQAPFKGPVGKVLKQVERGEWLPPLQVNKSVPAALDAICCKAMSLRPEERYSAAQALAEDLEHWLADEPVSAYAEPAGVRLRRWMRKRPRRVTGALVLLLTAVVGLTLGTVLLDLQKREAQDNLAMVQQQAKFFAQDVSEDVLLNEPGMEELRYNILKNALSTYEALLKKRPNDPKARRLWAGAMRQLGEVFSQTGQMVEAKSFVAQSVAAHGELLRDAPADQELRFGLARALHGLSNVQLQAGEVARGKSEVDRSIELLEELLAEEPGNGDYLLALAHSCELRATIEGLQGAIDLGLSDIERVIEILVDKAPKLPRRHFTLFVQGRRFLSGASGFSRFDASTTGWEMMLWPQVLQLGRACTNQGILLCMVGRDEESARMLERAIAVHQRLLELSAQSSPFRQGLAVALLHFGRVKVQLGQPRRGEPQLREALELMEKLVQENPYVEEYRAARLLAVGCLGESLFRQGRTAEAAELLRQVETEGDKVLVGSSKDLGLRGQYARLLQVLGCLMCDCGDLKRSLGICQKAHKKLEQARSEMSGDRSLQCDWLTSCETLTQCRFRSGDLSPAGWITEQQRIVEKRKGLVNQGRPSARLTGDLAESAAILAGLLLEANRPAEALACVDAVLPVHEKAVRAEQERVKAATKEKREEEVSLVPFAPYQDLLPSFLRKAPIVSDFSLQSRWAMLLARRGAALAHLGRDAEAAEAVRQAVAITAGIVFADLAFPAPVDPLASLWGAFPTLLWQPEPCALYDLTRLLALASTLPRGNGRPDLADQAMWFLHRSLAAGFDNLHQIRTDSILEPLRKREDFRKLVHDLDAKSARRKDVTQSP
jgi:tetratricopeptide (TPR) repeat protein/tRNA A-37 threonylcarbamoyl transferase component Bud32